jgi:hypothetical protein
MDVLKSLPIRPWAIGGAARAPVVLMGLRSYVWWQLPGAGRGLRAALVLVRPVDFMTIAIDNSCSFFPSASAAGGR